MYIKGHNVRDGGHWSVRASRDHTMRAILEGRRRLAYRLFDEGRTTHDFNEGYYALYDAVKTADPGAELEYIVKVGENYRAIDVALPDKKIGFEWDPGNRYRASSAANSRRDKELKAVGWTLVHVKRTPTSIEVRLKLALLKGESNDASKDEGPEAHRAAGS